VRSWMKFWLTALSLGMLAVVSACGGGDESGRLAPGDDTEAAADSSVRRVDANASIEPDIDGMEPVLENDRLRLYVGRSTAEIAVVDKSSGHVWYSNPPGRQDQSGMNEYIKGKLSSQLSLVYLSSNAQNKDYDSFNDSVKYNQFDIAVSDRDVTVTYRFGNPEKGLESIPEKLTAERFEELRGRLEDEADKEELERRYKFVPEQQIWERREIPKAVQKRVIALFEKLGYTEEDLMRDQEETGSEGTVVAGNPKLEMAISYTLDGDYLVATVDTASIQSEQSDLRIHSIRLLENFGAADQNASGYIFLPDGSGTLIPLNSGKLAAQPLYLPVYGQDLAFYIDEKFSNPQPVRLPVFGMKQNDAAFFAIIEKGDGIAWLNADIGGRQHPYNTVSANFVILPKDQVFLTQNEIMYKTPQKPYEGKLQIRYTFLNGENANYSGMAAAYRAYLERKYGLERLADGDIPFYLELTGDIRKWKNFMGIPYQGLVALSDLREAASIVGKLQAEHIGNIRLKYTGWFNGGPKHEFPADIEMDRVIGSKKDWDALAAQLRTGGGGFYPDVALLQVYDAGNGFKASEDAAQYVSRRYVRLFDYDRAAFFKKNFAGYLLSPVRWSETVREFLKEYARFNPGSISLRDLGDLLYSDFSRTKEADRDAVRRTAEQQLRVIAEQAPDIMVNGGNIYAVPYANHIVNVPMSSNEYQLASESVPFYQMVLHGYVDYAGPPFNLSDDQDVRLHVLRSLETGAGVHYSWIFRDPSVLKNTPFSYLYANHYEVWLEEAVQAYREVNGVLKRVRGQPIVRHEKWSDDVRMTEYENGVRIIVNYGDQAVTVNGILIEARDYYVEG